MRVSHRRAALARLLAYPRIKPPPEVLTPLFRKAKKSPVGSVLRFRRDGLGTPCLRPTDELRCASSSPRLSSDQTPSGGSHPLFRKAKKEPSGLKFSFSEGWTRHSVPSPYGRAALRQLVSSLILESNP
ncbi:MAG: hypothetical protein MRY21_01710, partial [Simkaniaceae bacterium]|nr:hypothetical protein [Simkaniaceae bacterium]